MTRVLSELLGAAEPAFHQNLQRLEAASGRSSADIRLSAELERAARAKLRELGLDPKDTTGTELYAVLQERVKVDDQRLGAALRNKYGDKDPVHMAISKALEELPVNKSCFALKNTVGKRLLTKIPPKQTMKALGYRSFESMVRREPILAIFAGAWLVESVTWRKGLLDSYKKLNASDFEIRPMSILAPTSKHWRELSAIVLERKHTVVGLKELGAVVVLPFPEEQPPAITLTTTLLALHEMNEVRSASTFLKLCQVHPDFGSFVQQVVRDEPTLNGDILGGPLPWHIIQRYYSRFSHRIREDLFEPHIQKDDLTWHSIEKALSFIEPSLAFWRHTSNLGILDAHQPVSMNVIDAALNFCNQLPYRNRIVHYLRHNLWSELMIRYLKHENVEQTVLSNLESQLVEEPKL